MNLTLDQRVEIIAHAYAAQQGISLDEAKTRARAQLLRLDAQAPTPAVLKCAIHVTWAVNHRAREIEDARSTPDRRYHIQSGPGPDDPELVAAARQAPNAEIITGGTGYCLPCFVEGRVGDRPGTWIHH